jgi:hypothetical protein
MCVTGNEFLFPWVTAVVSLYVGVGILTYNGMSITGEGLYNRYAVEYLEIIPGLVIGYVFLLNVSIIAIHSLVRVTEVILSFYTCYRGSRRKRISPAQQERELSRLD